MTDNELVDLCVTCGCSLVFSNCYFKPGDDIDMTLKSLRKSISATVLLPANFHLCYGIWRSTSSVLFALLRVSGNSSWRISSAYPKIIVQETYDEYGLPDTGLMTSSISTDDQLKFDEQVNRMSLESLKDLVFSIVRDCSAKTKELRRTEILESLKEWTA